MLSYTILYYNILYHTILYYIILYYTILYYSILYHTILYYTILYYTILFFLQWSKLYYIIPYYGLLDCSWSHYAHVLRCNIILYHVTQMQRMLLSYIFMKYFTIFYKKNLGTALLMAAHNGHVVIVEFLLDKGAAASDVTKVEYKKFDLIIFGARCVSPFSSWSCANKISCDVQHANYMRLRARYCANHASSL